MEWGTDFMQSKVGTGETCSDVVAEDGFAFLRKSPAAAACPRHTAKSRRLIHPQMRKTATPSGVTVFLVEEDGFEPSKAKPADLQSVPFGHLGTPPYQLLNAKLELVDGFEPPTC